MRMTRMCVEYRPDVEASADSAGSYKDGAMCGLHLFDPGVSTGTAVIFRSYAAHVDYSISMLRNFIVANAVEVILAAPKKHLGKEVFSSAHANYMLKGSLNQNVFRM